METAGLRKPQQSRSQQTLERIMQSGTALIAEMSYDDVSVNAIAARAQISVGGFYSRFENKEALLAALATNLGSETAARIDAAMEKDWSSTSLANLLEFIVRNNAELYRKYRGVLKVIHLRTRLLADDEADGQRLSYNAGIVDRIEELLLQKRGDIRHRQPRVAIRTAIACMTSMLRDAVVFEETSLYPAPADIRVITRSVASVMHRYLAAQTA